MTTVRSFPAATAVRCAGCGTRQVGANTVLCPPCAALVATSTPLASAAPTVNLEAPWKTYRIPVAR